MKYCIGCIHCDLMPGYQGAGGGTYTGPGSYFDPELLCKKKHWKLQIEGTMGSAGILDIEQEMRRAETCPDFSERPLREKTLKHLRYDMIAAYQAGERRHPQAHMKDIGITYLHATPQSLGDQWWFWNCKGVPEPLPAYLAELSVTPQEAVGHGLTKEMAEKIDSAANRT